MLLQTMRHEQGGPTAFHPDLANNWPQWAKPSRCSQSGLVLKHQLEDMVLVTITTIQHMSIITTSFGSETFPWQAFESCIIPYLTQDNKLLSNFHKTRNYILQIEQISTQSHCSKTSCSMQARNWIRLIYHGFLQSSLLATSDQEYNQCPALKEKKASNHHHEILGIVRLLILSREGAIDRLVQATQWEMNH